MGKNLGEKILLPDPDYEAGVAKKLQQEGNRVKIYLYNIYNI